MNLPFTMRALVVAMSAGAMGGVAANAVAAQIGQSGEQKDMRRVGHTDLQGRPAYQPNWIKYPDGRVIVFVGTHGGSARNPLNGNAVEQNGTMIVDASDPRNPVEKFHIPAPAAGAQTQSERICLGSDLSGDPTNTNVYMMRNVQTNALGTSGYEVWDVTNVTRPVIVSDVRNLRSTHKHWWECKTGIAYLPGSLGATSPDISDSTKLWRQNQSMLIYDWKVPTTPPKYLRTFGLPGAQPSGQGPVPPSLHGAISAHDHPKASSRLARGVTASDIIGNRVYAAWGVGDDGVMQVLDRSKLLPVSRGGTWTGNPDDPSDADLQAPQTAILYMSPDQGGHTAFPIFGIAPKSYQDFTEFQKRDIVMLASESTADQCLEAPHWSFVVDITVENSKAATPVDASNNPVVKPPLRKLQNPWQGPMVLSTLSVDPRSGEKYPRGNYCDRGARFGTHSSEENFANPFYGRVTFQAYFTGGVRAWDIREPQAPVEIAFYVPETNALTAPGGYMTNNLEVDNRGFIYAVDRNGAGLDILELHGKALLIGQGKR